MTDEAPPAWATSDVCSWDRPSKTMTVRGDGDQITMGRVPAGWTITLEYGGWAPGGPGFEVKGASADVEWVVIGQLSGVLLIPDRVKHLTIGQLTGASHEFRLVGSGCEITVRNRTAIIDGEGHTFDLVVEEERARSATIRGSAAISAIRSTSGPCTIASTVAAGAVVADMKSQATFEQTLTDVTFDSPELNLTAPNGIENCKSVLVRGLFASHVTESTVTAATEMRITGVVSGSSLTVTESAPGPAMWITTADVATYDFAAGSFDEIQAEMDSDNHQRWARKVGEGGVVTNSDLICLGGGDIVATSLQGTGVEAGGSLVVGKATTLHSGDRRTVEVAGDALLNGGAKLGDGTVVTVAGAAWVRSLEGGTFNAGHVTVQDDLVSSTVKAGRVATFGPIEGANIEATERLVVLGGGEASARLRLHGDGAVREGFEGAIHWTPVTSNELAILEPPSSLVIEVPTEIGAVLRWGAGDAPFPKIAVRGEVTIATVDRRPGGNPNGRAVNELEILDGDTVVTAGAGAGLTIEDLHGAAGGTVRFRDDAAVEVSRASGLRLFCEDRATVTVFRDDGSEGVVKLSVAGSGTLSVECFLDALDAELGLGQAPWLAVAENGHVDMLTGDLRLKSVEGIVAGRAGEREMRWWPWSRATEAGRAPKIHEIEKMDADTEGVVINVDPTPVPYHQLLHTEPFQVFEPDTVAMLGYTPRSPKGHDRFAARRGAYKTQRLADLVAGGAASGGARSAASWAAARAHHRTVLVSKAPFEWALRVVHRALGYSQRPGPPFVTYLIALTVWTAAHSIYFDPGKGDPRGNWFWNFWHMAVLPASFLARLPENSRSFPYVLDSYGMNTLAFVTTGVPLVFFFIALRHFLAAPSKK